VAVCAAVVLARFVWIFPATYLPRRLVRGIREHDPSPAPSAVLVIGWAGLRGVVSLALVLALPLDFPERDLLLFLTFAVILVTLVVQGLSLPWLLRTLGLSDGGQNEAEESVARGAATDAALARLTQLRVEWPGHIPLIENMEERYRHRTEHLVADAGGDGATEDQERIEHRAILSAVIGAEREAVLHSRDTGVINDDVMRRIERELDLEELRMEADL
jgi:CPA1 family monovalent cation:H+ antiporter